MFFGSLIAVVIMGAVIYMALNKKSNFQVRMASLGALAVMILTLIICIIAYVNGGEAPIDWSTYKVTDEPAEKKDDSSNLTVIVFSILFFLALFVVILALAMKEHKKTKPKSDSLII